MPFSAESRPTNSTSGGSAGSPTCSGSSTALGITRTSPAPSSRAASASAFEAQIDEPRPRKHAPREDTRVRRASSTSVPQSCTTNGLPVASATAPEGSQCACTRSASRDARRAARANEAEHRRHERQLPRRALQVAQHARAVGDPEVAEGRRRDDLDLDPAPAQLLDRVGDEVPGRVALVARVRGRQHDDLHRREKTAGVASTSITKT